MLKLFVVGMGLIFAVSVSAEEENVISRTSLEDFPHKLHQKSLGGCEDCHGKKGPGKIENFNDQWAHNTCVGCHKENKTGPTECAGCHRAI